VATAGSSSGGAAILAMSLRRVARSAICWPVGIRLLGLQALTVGVPLAADRTLYLGSYPEVQAGNKRVAVPAIGPRASLYALLRGGLLMRMSFLTACCTEVDPASLALWHAALGSVP